MSIRHKGWAVRSRGADDELRLREQMPWAIMTAITIANCEMGNPNPIPNPNPSPSPNARIMVVSVERTYTCGSRHRILMRLLVRGGQKHVAHSWVWLGMVWYWTVWLGIVWYGIVLYSNGMMGQIVGAR